MKKYGFLMALLAAILVVGTVSAALGCAGKPAAKEEPKKEEAKKEESKAQEQPKAQPAEDEIKIGFISPITGDVATFGESTRNAVMLAAKQWNQKGGLLGKQIKIIVEDDSNDPVQSGNAARKLISQDKVVAIIGSVASKCTLAAAPIAQEAKIPLISPTSTADAVTKVGDYIFRACFIDPFQGAVMAKFAREDLQAKTAAALYDLQNDYTKGLAEEFKKAFEKLGGKIVAFETYAYGDQDFRAQLTKIKGQNPDVLFLPDYYNTVGLITKQARDLGIKATFLGGDGWDSPDLVPIAGDSIEGGYFSNHYSTELKNPEAVQFLNDYKNEYKKDPDALAALAYEAANVLFDSIKRAGSTDPKAIRDAMAATKDFATISGKITFDQNRNPMKAAVILQIKGGKQKFIKAVAP